MLVLWASKRRDSHRGVERGAGPHDLQRKGTHIEVWSMVLVLMSSKEKGRDSHRGVECGAVPHELQREENT